MAETIEKIKIDIDFDLDEPENYNLILLNDDTSPIEFVILGLAMIGIDFNKAIELAQTAHFNGKAVVGTYVQSVCQAMKKQIEEFMHANGCKDFHMGIEPNK